MLDPDRAEGEALARVCVEKLGGYLRDEGGDQNRPCSLLLHAQDANDAVKYIALLAMVKIIPTHPAMIAEYQEEIMASMDDPDVSIRIRALELVTSMVGSPPCVRLNSCPRCNNTTSNRLSTSSWPIFPRRQISRYYHPQRHPWRR